MSMQSYDEAVTILAKYPEIGFFAGPRQESLIQAAERKLGLRFPSTYRRFLLEFGAGNVGSDEILGVIHEDFDESGVPDAVWYTIRQRQQVNLPHNLVVIYEVGDGELFCLDLAMMKNNEAPIVAYQPGYPPEEQLKEIIAKDFGDFLLELVQRKINA
ncbi:MAG: SMI1/KNR4 family protein [Anaerolineae bacterium]